MANPIYVPIRLDAMVLNKGNIDQCDHRRWKFHYSNLDDFTSPMSGSDDADPPRGVYLHWTMPRALRTRAPGAADYPLVPNRWLVVRASDGMPRPTKAWIVESDCPTSDGGVSFLVRPEILRAWAVSSDKERRDAVADLVEDSSKPSVLTIDPSRPSDHVQDIGRCFDFSEWKERTSPKEPLYLRAVSPSNAVFSTYVPNNINVFSFRDDLKDLGEHPQGSLSYYVVGWYSDPACDIVTLTNGDLLGHLGWTWSGDRREAIDRSFYCGTVFTVDPDLAWSASDPCYAPSQGEGLNVAVGNSTVDAFMALLSANTDVPDNDLQLIRALQSRSLDVLNQPGGSTLLDELVRRSWFSAKPGGTRWSLVTDKGVDVALSDAEGSWLERLNIAQTAQDVAVAELFTLQRLVLDRWIQRGYYSPDAVDGVPGAPLDFEGAIEGDIPTLLYKRLSDDLDPTKPETSAARLIAKFDAVISGHERLAVRETGDARTGSDGRAGGRQYSFGPDPKVFLHTDKVLKPIAAEPFHVASDPVVVVSGVTPAPDTLPEDRLAVRSREQLIHHLSVGGRSVDAAALGAIAELLNGLERLPEGAAAFLDECGLLDPGNAEGLGLAAPVDPRDAKTIGALAVPPAYGLSLWKQPWEPMFLEWTMNHVQLPSEAGGARCWAFDGTDYVLTPHGQQIFRAIPSTGADLKGSHQVSGLSLLGAQIQQVFARRLEGFLTSFRGEAGRGGPEQGWKTEIDEVLGWKFVSQELSGFNMQLAGRDPRPFRRPTLTEEIHTGPWPRPFAELVGLGHRGGALPDELRGAATAPPFVDGSHLPFDGLRRTVAWFTDLTLYDKFGRAVRVISDTGRSDAKSFEFDIDRALCEPGKGTRGRYICMPPRLLQGAHLDFDLIDAHDDAKTVGIHAGANPICGFLLPNHLDRSLSIYLADGRPLGDLGLVEHSDGSRRCEFQTVPNGAVKTLAEVHDVSPHMFNMLNDDRLREEASFNAFLDAIDATLWTVDPLGNRVDQNLSVLIGRPLALLRTRLGIGLDGPPLEDPGWVATGHALGILPGERQSPQFTDEPLSIRVGDRAIRHDGVIGYFEADNYSSFNAVTPSATGENDAYVRPIGPVGATEGGNYVTLTCKPGDSRMLTVLADPRASLHAVTGLFPVKSLAIPTRFVEQPLRTLAVSFRLGPILTKLQPQEGASDTSQPSQAVTLPVPAEQKGAWSWYEVRQTSVQWTPFRVIEAVAQARLEPGSRSLREGILQLQIATDDEASTEGQTS